MGLALKSTVAAIIVGAFGLFMIWQGITGNVFRSSSGDAIFPRWVYIVSGIIVLILPVAYLILCLFL